MEWAIEGNDRPMVSRALFRRSQQAAADRDGAQVASLAAAARREADGLPGCWLTLGRPARAVTSLDTAIRSLPPACRRAGVTAEPR